MREKLYIEQVSSFISYSVMIYNVSYSNLHQKAKYEMDKKPAVLIVKEKAIANR